MNISEINNPDDTIAAISTPVGVGGIGIVRLSGPQAVTVAEKIFTSAGRDPLPTFLTHTVHFGKIHDAAGNVVDDVLVTVMRAPRTYTGEDIVEVSGHGGPVVLKMILDLLIRHGARLADPGEFTRRAFLNGRMDLVQAEAVLEIIRAKSESSLRVSTQQLEGDLSRALAKEREAVMALYAQLEAIVNFPEDVVTALDQKSFLNSLENIGQHLQSLLDTSNEGRIITEGIQVAICGRPNAGKSSLLNVFLRQPRAIVSPIPGTTRDTIEETTEVNGIALHLIDTAGVLVPRDTIEAEAIRRSQAAMERADLVLFLLDGSGPLRPEDAHIRSLLADRPTVIAVTKSDLPHTLTEADVEKFFPGKRILRVSALTLNGIEELKAALVDHVMHGKAIDTHRVIVTNLRHVESLRHARRALCGAADCLRHQVPFEFICEELRGALKALDRITGRQIDADVLDQIFSKFCIGK